MKVKHEFDINHRSEFGINLANLTNLLHCRVVYLTLRDEPLESWLGGEGLGMEGES